MKYLIDHKVLILNIEFYDQSRRYNFFLYQDCKQADVKRQPSSVDTKNINGAFLSMWWGGYSTCISRLVTCIFRTKIQQWKEHKTMARRCRTLPSRNLDSIDTYSHSLLNFYKQLDRNLEPSLFLTNSQSSLYNICVD